MGLRMIRDASYRGDKISIVDLEMRLVVGNVASSIHVPTCLDELLEMGFEAMRLQQFLQARGMGLAWLDFARFVPYLRKNAVTKRSSDNSTVSQRDVASFPYTSAVELRRFLQHHVFVAIVHQDDSPLETNRSSHSRLELSVIDFVRLLALLRRLVELVQLVSEEDSEQGQIVCDNRTCQKCITMQQVMVLPCVHGVSVMCTKSVDRHQWQMESWDETEVKAVISNLQQRIQSFFAGRHENRCIKWQQVEDFLIFEKSLDHVEIEDNCILVTCCHAK